MFDASTKLGSWLIKLLAGHPKQIALGLERISVVAEQLGLPIVDNQVRLGGKVIVVAGTNGKGSVCAMVERIYSSAGYTTALYSSPHILKFNERLCLNGEPLADNHWIEAFEEVEKSRQKIEGCKLTFFEVCTLAAMLVVEKFNPDVSIFEVGLGGRLDAVNLLDNDCSVLTSIGLDHQSFLGNSIDEIGWEKIHIARSGKPLIIAEKNLPVSVTEFLKNVSSNVSHLGKDFYFETQGKQWSWFCGDTSRHGLAFPALRGIHQLINASAALATTNALSEDLPISQGAARNGLATVELPARFQVLAGQPLVILDVAHNEGAANMLCKNLDETGFYPRTFGVLGMLRDKDVSSVYKILRDKIDLWFFVDLSYEEAGDRSQTAEAIYKTVKLCDPKMKARCFKKPEDGFAAAFQMAKVEDRIVVLGSFITIASVWNEAHKSLKS
ncbi:MAG: hypothetical protein CBC42_06580 [Betaproteobacteria bacterium TMED82]|nr:MAG: hypothetical protein CBC42_06580 [Betaproteobacteria bacterium TMED82]|tara:strand:+ start:3912 stop:5234 length:1323 start_codon:yes stop_codon:yes gene_type:complete